MILKTDLAALTERRLSSLHAEISFPRGSDYDNITHIKVVISPDEGIYRVSFCMGYFHTFFFACLPDVRQTHRVASLTS
jgi:hypothetical protein